MADSHGSSLVLAGPVRSFSCSLLKRCERGERSPQIQTKRVLFSQPLAIFMGVSSKNGGLSINTWGLISSPGNLLQLAMETHHFLLGTSSHPDGPWFPVCKRLHYRRPFWAPGRLGPSVIHWLDVSNANVLKWKNPEGSLGAHSIIYP
jgi:hypothetical protein